MRILEEEECLWSQHISILLRNGLEGYVIGRLGEQALARCFPYHSSVPSCLPFVQCIVDPVWHSASQTGFSSGQHELELHSLLHDGSGHMEEAGGGGDGEHMDEDEQEDEDEHSIGQQ